MSDSVEVEQILLYDTVKPKFSFTPQELATAQQAAMAQAELQDRLLALQQAQANDALRQSQSQMVQYYKMAMQQANNAENQSKIETLMINNQPIEAKPWNEVLGDVFKEFMVANNSVLMARALDVSNKDPVYQSQVAMIQGVSNTLDRTTFPVVEEPVQEKPKPTKVDPLIHRRKFNLDE